MNDETEVKVTGDDLAGWQVELPTGQVYKAPNKDALLNEVVKAQLNASMTLQQKETQLQESRRIIDEQAERNRQDEQRGNGRGNGNGNDTPELTREQFNKRYWELINADPLAAMEYANQVYFGFDNPRATVQKSAIVAEYVSDSVATREFLKDNPDFPASPANSEKVLGELTRRDLEVTSYNLERVWKDLKRENAIVPLSAKDIADEQKALRRQAAASVGEEGEEEVEQPRRRNAPPSPGGGSDRATQNTSNTLSDEQLDKFAQMGRAEREKILREKGMM